MKQYQNQFSYYTTLQQNAVLEALETSSLQGLSATQAHERKLLYGYNQLKSKGKSGWKILIRQCSSPFIYVLLIAAILSLFLQNTIEGTVILIILLMNVLFGFFQEYKAEKTAQLLQHYLINKVSVIRDGQEQEIATNELVPGDIVILYPGTIIPADMRIIEEQNFFIDESVATGETVPVHKTATALPAPAQDLFTAHNICFAGTTVTQGKGKGIVFATGKDSSLGKLTEMAWQINRVSSFSKIIAQFSRFILYLILISLVLIFSVHLIIKQGKVDFFEFTLFIIALSLSIIPEALPLVMTFALSQGALRLARNKTIVKRLSAIEDLGNIEILCTDKTGTLTENVMKVDSIRAQDPQQTLILATLVGIKQGKHTIIPRGFDTALYEALSPEQQQGLSSYTLIQEIPFDSVRIANAVLVTHMNTYSLIMRGAPEKIVEQCKDLADQEKTNILQWITQEGKKGNRILAIAHRETTPTVNILTEIDQPMTLAGLIAFQDPIKKSVPQALEKAASLGLTVKILSGDSKDVCAAVACKLGLVADCSAVMTGAEFERKTPEEKERIVTTYNVFARVSPENKHEIIKLLSKDHDVGYMGDGINDVLALKEAHVGLVVADAVDVARSAADIILLKKSLMVVVDGIEEGRLVFANTVKYLRTTLSASFGNFYSVGLAALILDYLPLLPIQILLLNLMSDFPMITIATDNVSKAELKRPETYDVKSTLILALFLGFICTIFDFIFFAFFFHENPAILQTGWFIESILTELVFIFSIRTNKFFLKGGLPSAGLILISLATGILAVILPFTFLGHYLFELVPLHRKHFIIIGGVVVGYFIVSELIKLVYIRVQPKKNNVSAPKHIERKIS